MSYVRPASDALGASWVGAAGYSRPAGDALGASWVGGGGGGGGSQLEALVLAPSPLGAPAVLGYHDFSAFVGDVVSRYVVDVTGPLGGAPLRLAPSSWQATLQAGRASYVQCVIPAVTAYVQALAERQGGEFVVLRQAVLPDGSALEYEMARSPMQALTFDRGPLRHTLTMSGYAYAFAPAGEVPDAAFDRTLQGVRSVSSGGGWTRVRCSVDWLLRPGHRALFDGGELVTAYINYFVGGGDAYMDVGDRS